MRAHLGNAGVGGKLEVEGSGRAAAEVLRALASAVRARARDGKKACGLTEPEANAEVTEPEKSAVIARVFMHLDEV